MRRLSFLFFAMLTAAAPLSDAYVFGTPAGLMTVGDDIDMAMAGRLPAKYGADFLWLRRDGKTFVIRDSGAIKRADAIVTPQRDLDRKRLDIARRQAGINREISTQAKEQALIGAEIAKLSPSADPAKLAELQGKMDVVSEKIHELNARQDGLTSELRLVVEQQEKLRPVLMKELGAFADDAIAHGTAKAE